LPILASGNDVEVLLKMSTNGNPLIVESGSKKKQREARLDSWKEIAIYLRREIRTVQRWEQGEGLPVKRIFHRKGSSVYAFTNELDVWLASRSPSQVRSLDVKKKNGCANMPSRIVLVARGAKSWAVESNTECKAGTIASGDLDSSNSPEFKGLLANGNGLVNRKDNPLQVMTRQTVRISFYVACQQSGGRGAFGHFQEICGSKRLSPFGDFRLCRSGPLGEGAREKEQLDELPN
jgi:hypothetical protein